MIQLTGEAISQFVQLGVQEYRATDTGDTSLHSVKKKPTNPHQPFTTNRSMGYTFTISNHTKSTHKTYKGSIKLYSQFSTGHHGELPPAA